MAPVPSFSGPPRLRHRLLAALLAMLPALAGDPAAAALERAFAGRAGTAVLLDAGTGRVRASWRLDRATARLAAPGSTVKPFVAELAPPGFTALCRRTVTVNARRFDCAHPPINGPMDAASALALSCNSWFVQAAARLDAARLNAALARAGLPAPGGTDVRLQVLGEDGARVTPLELAQAYRQLALKASREVRRGLRLAVESGTAQLAGVEGLSVAGKTGTSTPHAWFAGWAPAERPEVVVVVLVDQGRGAADAAPVAGEILRAWRGGPAGVRVKAGDAVRVMGLEPYVLAAVAGEGGGMREAGALKALAVAARSYAVAERGRHAREGFDFCETTHCQDARWDEPARAVREAVEETEGELLWFQGRLAAGFHHKDCGGRTAGAEEVWGGAARPYLRSRAEDAHASGSTGWNTSLPLADLAAALGLRAAHQVEVALRGASGRVKELRVDGRPFDAETVHMAVGRRCGWNVLKSRWYEAEARGGRVVFAGRGAGHGVGLCQTGAQARAGGGANYRQILGAYFPGTATGVSATGLQWERRQGERVEAWCTARCAADVVALADRILEDAERRAGWHASGRPRVKVFPTVDAFRDATGQPGNVAGSTRGQTVRLMPDGLLRSKGLLEGTLRHEWLHVLLNQRAVQPAPEWFEEGLVTYLAGGKEQRVRGLVERHGRETVLGWLRTGVPAGVH